MKLHWKSVVLWAAIIFTATQIAALIASVIFRPDGLLPSSKLAFDIVVEVTSFFATTLFFLQARKPLVIHGVAVFILVYIIDTAVYWLLTKNFDGLPGISDLSKSVISWLAAYFASAIWLRIFRRVRS